MSTLREYLQSLSPSKKKTPNEPLMERMRQELSAEQPDYSVCLDALLKFRPQTTGAFYSDVYPSLSKSVQKEWNQEFLKWVDSQSPAKRQTAFLRMSQAIKARLEQMEKADELSLEIQWFIAHFSENGERAISDVRDMKDKTSMEQLRKLLVLPVENWPVDKESLRTFFDILFADFPAERLEKEYRIFLMRTGLDAVGHDDSHASEAEPQKAENALRIEPLPKKPVSKEDFPESVTKRAASAEKPEESPVEREQAEQSVSAMSAATPSKASEKSDAESLTPENASAISAESPESPQVSQVTPLETEKQSEMSTEISVKKTVPETPSSKSAENAVPETLPSESAENAVPETLPSESAKNAAEQPQSSGTSAKANEPAFLKFLERALASAKQEARNTEKLKESLARSESSLRESERQREDLTRKLGAARQENAELRMCLEKAERQAESDRETALKMRDEADTLQRMNKNSAAQAVAGYKAELNSALKDILEKLTDTEAREDIEILSALCEHLLDTLKYKGISLEEQ